MSGLPMSLTYLLVSWGGVTAFLLLLLIYGNTLSIREDDELYLNKAQDHMMAAEQKVLVAKMGRLKTVIVVCAVFSAVLLVASASVWVWMGFHI